MSAKEEPFIEGVTRPTRSARATAFLFVLAALALIGVAVGFLAAARQIDQLSRRHEEVLVHNGLTLKESACLDGTSNWDEAVVNLDNRYDGVWATSNIAHFLWTRCDAIQSYVLGPNNQVLGAWRRDEAVDPQALKPIAPTVQTLVAKIRRREALRGPIHHRSRQTETVAQPIDETTLAMSRDGAVIVVASLIEPYYGDALPAGARAPILINVEPFDQSLLDWLGTHFMLEGLRFQGLPLGAMTSREANLDLTDDSGQVIGRLAWSHMKSTEDLALVVAPMLVLLLVVLIGASTLIVWRERAQSRLLSVAMGKAQAASNEKSRFIANISHEIRTPMNGVLGILHLLKRKGLDSDSALLVDEATISGQLLLGLLNDVLDLSRIEEGRMDLELAALDPAGVLREVTGLFAGQALGKNIQLEAKNLGEAGRVMADPIRLKQVLLNLVGNAVKFTEHGRVEVRLKLSAPRDDGRRSLRFEVEDTGIGIPEAAQQAVFGRFVQADGSTVRRFGGSGLGLSICDAMVALMGGRLGVTSRDGEGSTFWFEIEALDAPDEPAKAPAREVAQAADGGDRAEGLRILLVEDNPTNRLVATRLLEVFAADVQVAENGLEGYEAAQRGAFDLILMDVQMPVMDGVTATRQIRLLDGAQGDVPIFALTANAMPAHRQSYLEAGMNDVIVKPINPAELIRKIEALLLAD